MEEMTLLERFQKACKAKNEAEANACIKEAVRQDFHSLAGEMIEDYRKIDFDSEDII